MARISTYPIISEPTLNDLLIGTDVEDLNITKNFTIGDIASLIIGGSYVPYIGATENVDLGAFDITSSAFIVGGGLATQFLKADGSLDATIYQPAGNYITQLSGEATASGPGNATVTLSNSAVINKVLTGLNITGAAIVATDSILTAFGKVQNQINTLVGGVQYKGTWNAATNTPTLVSSVGVQGNYYVVNVAGNTNLNGITDWNLGDWAIFNGSAWEKVDNTDAVISVNGQVGAVVLTTTNIAEGTNLYYTDLRARSAISLTTTGNSGASTYSNLTGILNVPNYTLAGLGGVPLTRELTINGTTFDLSANRSWSVGTVTSISTTGPLTGGTITGSGTIGITQSGASSDGYLSSTDWNTFNNKQNALTNPVTGTGTIFTLPMWSGATSLADSPLSYGPDAFNFQYNSATGGTVNFTNIGLTPYTYAIQMNNFGSPRSTVHSYTDGVVVQSIGGTQVSRMFANGNFILGTGVVDNGYKLELSGTLALRASASASAATQVPVFIASPSGTTRELVTRTPAQLLGDAGAIAGTLATGQVAFGTAANTIGGSADFVFGTSQLTINRAAGNSRLNLQEAGVTIASLQAFSGAVRLLNSGSGSVELHTSGGLRWSVLATGQLQSNGAQTIQTSTGNLTIATAAGNGNIVLSPNGSGGVGVGIIPSAWAGLVPIQISRGSISANTGEIDFNHNSFFDGSWKYIANGFATNHFQTSGAYFWRTAPSGIAGNTVTFTEAMRLTNTNNLLIGTGTDAGFRLDVNGTARVQGVLTTTADAVVNGVNIGRGGGAISTNTRVGTSALNANTSGSANSSFGINAGLNNTTGSANSFFGVSAGASNITTSNNSFFGRSSGQSNTDSNNTFVGFESGSQKTTGSNNSFFGTLSGRHLADGATALTISNNSIFIGYDTRSAADNQTNQIVIGHNAIGLGSNTTVLGNTSTTHGRWYGSLLLGTTTNAASSILTMESTTQGFLPPRMTTTQRNAIASPATGLVVYDTTLNDPFYYNGTAWTMFQDGITLTTTGTSGAATLVGTTLNIPQYQAALTNPVTGTGTSGQVAYFNGTSSITGESNLFWDSTNDRLGIGTASPNYLLHIAAGAANPQLQFTSTGTGSTTSDGFHIGINNSTLNAFILQKENASLQFLTNDTERMRLDASGNLGLGVTPSAWNSAYKAFQFGTTGALFGESGDAANYFTTNTFVDSVGFKYITSDWALGYFQENGVHSWRTAPSGTAGNAISFTQAMTLGSNSGLSIGTPSAAPSQGLLVQGNVGIGGSPSFKLDVNSLGYGIQHYGNGSNYLRTYAGSSYQVIESNGTNQFGYFNGNFFVQTSATDRLTIASTGAATFTAATQDAIQTVIRMSGKNASSQIKALDFKLNAGTPLWTISTAAEGTDAGINIMPNGSAGLSLAYSTGAATFSSSVTANARSFIQGAAGYLFDVQTTDANQPRFQVYVDDTNGVDLISGYNSTAKSLRFVTGNTPRMTITSGGNVGIGTTNPAQKFSVEGEIAKYCGVGGVDGSFENLIKYGFAADLQSGTSQANRWIGIDATVTAGSAVVNTLRIRAYSGGTGNAAPVNVADFRGDQSSVFYGNVLIGTTTTPTPVSGVAFPLTVSSSAATRIRIDSTNASPNSGVGLYANGVQKFSFAMYGATSDFTIYNDALLAPSLTVKGTNSNVLVGTTTDTSDKLRVNGNTFTNTLMTWNPQNDNRSGVEWRFGAATIGTDTPNRRLRVSVGGMEYYIAAVEV